MTWRTSKLGLIALKICFQVDVNYNFNLFVTGIAFSIAFVIRVTGRKQVCFVAVVRDSLKTPGCWEQCTPKVYISNGMG